MPGFPPRARRRSRALLPALIFLLALAPRAPGLAPVATWDELFWTHAALRFHAALATGRWTRTYVIGQPGVVPMWLWSGLITLTASGEGPAARAELVAFGDRLRETKYPQDDVALMRRIARAWRGPPPLAAGTAMATALACCLLFGVLRRGWGQAPAALAALRLAWDPYFLAHSRVVALDAILAGLSVLAVALALDHARSGRRRSLAAGAAVAGMAMLTKLPGGAALAYGGAVVAIGSTGRAMARGLPAASLTGLRAGALWTLVGLATWVLGWPAMWDVPAKTIGQLRDTLAVYQTAAYDGMFFMGQAGVAPGTAFYPAVALWRTLPLTLPILAAAALAALVGLARRRPSTSVPRLVDLAAWLGFAVAYGAVLTLADSKYERYLLPALAALALAAGLAAGAWLRAWAGRPGAGPARSRLAALAFAVLLLEPLAGRGWRDGLAFYNPLAGGAAEARAVLPQGWGEGTEQVAAYLASLGPAEALTVAAEGSVSLLPDFPGRIIPARGAACREADLVLVYVFDRQLGQPAARAYEGQAPLFVAQVRGADYAWLYAGGRDCPE